MYIELINNNMYGLIWIWRIVESVGERVIDIKEGDLVVPIFNGECGECCYCKSKVTNMCERFGASTTKKVMEGDGTSRFSTIQGKTIFHFLNTSTFTEYTVVDTACVVKLHPDLTHSLKKLTLISCGVSTGKCLIQTQTNEIPFGYILRGSKTLLLV